MKLCSIDNSEISFYPFYFTNSLCVSTSGPTPVLLAVWWLYNHKKGTNSQGSCEITWFHTCRALRRVLTQNKQAFHMLSFICLFGLPSIGYIAISSNVPIFPLFLTRPEWISLSLYLYIHIWDKFLGMELVCQRLYAFNILLGVVKLLSKMVVPIYIPTPGLWSAWFPLLPITEHYPTF